MADDLDTPEACTSMPEVRAGIDRLDRRIVALLGVRFRYIEAAAAIKDDIEAVRDEARIAAVIDNAVKAAEAEGVPAELVRTLFTELVEASVAYETKRFRDKRAGL